jgi:RNA polymerase I-specific transcription initiation factor RRN7
MRSFSQLQLQRFPKGQRCTFGRCKAKQFYEENGHFYCRNNHELEGIVEDAGDGDEIATGRTKVTIRMLPKGGTTNQAPEKRLKGPAARILLLECFQIILRHQLRWLINEKDHPESLEAVAHELWERRIRGSPDDPAEVYGWELDPIQQHGSQPEESQNPEESDSEGEDGPKEDWNPDLGTKWPMPSMFDLLGICYLACVRLELPTRIADISHWVNNESMPWKNIVSESNSASIPASLLTNNVRTLYCPWEPRLGSPRL